MDLVDVIRQLSAAGSISSRPDIPVLKATTGKTPSKSTRRDSSAVKIRDDLIQQFPCLRVDLWTAVKATFASTPLTSKTTKRAASELLYTFRTVAALIDQDSIFALSEVLAHMSDLLVVLTAVLESLAGPTTAADSSADNALIALPTVVRDAMESWIDEDASAVNADAGSSGGASRLLHRIDDITSVLSATIGMFIKVTRSETSDERFRGILASLLNAALRAFNEAAVMPMNTRRVFHLVTATPASSTQSAPELMTTPLLISLLVVRDALTEQPGSVEDVYIKCRQYTESCIIQSCFSADSMASYSSSFKDSIYFLQVASVAQVVSPESSSAKRSKSEDKKASAAASQKIPLTAVKAIAQENRLFQLLRQESSGEFGGQVLRSLPFLYNQFMERHATSSAYTRDVSADVSSAAPSGGVGVSGGGGSKRPRPTTSPTVESVSQSVVSSMPKLAALGWFVEAVCIATGFQLGVDDDAEELSCVVSKDGRVGQHAVPKTAELKRSAVVAYTALLSIVLERNLYQPHLDQLQDVPMFAACLHALHKWYVHSLPALLEDVRCIPAVCLASATMLELNYTIVEASLPLILRSLLTVSHADDDDASIALAAVRRLCVHVVYLYSRQRRLTDILDVYAGLHDCSGAGAALTYPPHLFAFAAAFSVLPHGQEDDVCKAVLEPCKAHVAKANHTGTFFLYVLAELLRHTRLTHASMGRTVELCKDVYKHVLCAAWQRRDLSPEQMLPLFELLSTLTDAAYRVHSFQAPLEFQHVVSAPEMLENAQQLLWPLSNLLGDASETSSASKHSVDVSEWFNEASFTSNDDKEMTAALCNWALTRLRMLQKCVSDVTKLPKRVRKLATSMANCVLMSAYGQQAPATLFLFASFESAVTFIKQAITARTNRQWLQAWLQDGEMLHLSEFMNAFSTAMRQCAAEMIVDGMKMLDKSVKVPASLDSAGEKTLFTVLKTVMDAKTASKASVLPGAAHFCEFVGLFDAALTEHIISFAGKDAWILLIILANTLTKLRVPQAEVLHAFTCSALRVSPLVLDDLSVANDTSFDAELSLTLGLRCAIAELPSEEHVQFDGFISKVRKHVDLPCAADALYHWITSKQVADSAHSHKKTVKGAHKVVKAYIDAATTPISDDSGALLCFSVFRLAAVSLRFATIFCADSSEKDQLTLVIDAFKAILPSAEKHATVESSITRCVSMLSEAFDALAACYPAGVVFSRDTLAFIMRSTTYTTLHAHEQGTHTPILGRMPVGVFEEMLAATPSVTSSVPHLLCLRAVLATVGVRSSASAVVEGSVSHLDDAKVRQRILQAIRTILPQLVETAISGGDGPHRIASLLCLREVIIQSGVVPIRSDEFTLLLQVFNVTYNTSDLHVASHSSSRAAPSTPVFGHYLIDALKVDINKEFGARDSGAFEHSSFRTPSNAGDLLTVHAWLLHSIIKYRQLEAMASMAVLFHAIQRIVIGALEFLSIHKSEAVINALTRLMEQFGRNTRSARYYAVHLLATVFHAFTKSHAFAGVPELPTEVRDALLPGTHALLDACTSKELQQLHIALGRHAAARAMLKSVHKAYESHHKYTGKV